MENLFDDDRVAFQHKTGKALRAHTIPYRCKYGNTSLEGSLRDEVIHINGYRFEREYRPPEEELPSQATPWLTKVLDRNDIARMCGVSDREGKGDSYDYEGVVDGHAYVAYGAEEGQILRCMETEERVFADLERQGELLPFLISSVNGRLVDEDETRPVQFYWPEGRRTRSTAADRTMSAVNRPYPRFESRSHSQ